MTGGYFVCTSTTALEHRMISNFESIYSNISPTASNEFTLRDPVREREAMLKKLNGDKPWKRLGRK